MLGSMKTWCIFCQYCACLLDWMAMDNNSEDVLLEPENGKLSQECQKKITRTQ